MDFCRELSGRVRRVQDRLEGEKIDALYVSNPKNVFYLTGKESGRVLLTKKLCFLWVRELYKEVYADLYRLKDYPFKVDVYDDDSVSRKVKLLKVHRLGVEDVSLGHYKGIRGRFKCRLKPVSTVEEQRAVKTDYEVRMLEKSASMAVKGMEKARQVVRLGVRELDAVAEIEHELRKLGSETPPFNEGMLLSSGKRSADIHAQATKTGIKKGLVIVDLGARFNGYYSDISRTLVAGAASKRERQTMEFVRNLELKAVDIIKPGVKASEVHDFIETRLKKKGFGFHHSAGHGIGLEVHEKPGLSPKSEDVLEEGMVFTIEPGVYLPGRHGVRFEDMVVLTKKGCRILTEVL